MKALINNFLMEANLLYIWACVALGLHIVYMSVILPGIVILGLFYGIDAWITPTGIVFAELIFSLVFIFSIHVKRAQVKYEKRVLDFETQIEAAMSVYDLDKIRAAIVKEFSVIPFFIERSLDFDRLLKLVDTKLDMMRNPSLY